MPAVRCLCDGRPVVPTRAGFCLLMHGTEPMRPSNTGWLVADVVEDTSAFAWTRTATDPALLALLDDPERRPFVVFPGGEGTAPRQVRAVAPGDGRRPLFVLLDGTWAEARKMFRRSPYLDALPVLSLPESGPPRYRLRRAGRREERCTADVAARCLELAGEPAAAAALDGWLDGFIEASVRTRNGS